MNFFSHSFNFYCSKLFWWPWKSISIVVLSLISINPVFTENSCTLRKHTTTFRKTNDCTSKQRSSCCKANQLLQPVAYGQNVSACAAQTCSVISYGAYIWNKTYICTDFSFLFFFLLIHPKTCFNLMAPYHDAAITDTNYPQELIKNYLWVHQWIFPSDISSCCCHTSKLSTRTMKWFSGNLPGPSINVVMQFTDAMTKTC